MHFRSCAKMFTVIILLPFGIDHKVGYIFLRIGSRIDSNLAEFFLWLEGFDLELAQSQKWLYEFTFSQYLTQLRGILDYNTD